MPNTTSNRLKRQSSIPHSKPFWCCRCDRNKVTQDEICSVCGCKNMKGRKRRYKLKQKYIREEDE